MNVTDEIKQKVDIVDVVSQYVKLHKSGRNFKANCPFHTEKTPSFFVFPDKQSWHCFGACGTGGDVFTFVMKKEGLEFGQALRQLAEKANVTLIHKSEQNIKEDQAKQEHLFKINEIVAEYFHHLLLHSAEGEAARQYTKKRGLRPKTLDNFSIGFALNKWDDLSNYLLKAGYSKDEMLSLGLIVTRESGGYYDRFRNRLIFPIRDIKGHIIGFGGRSLDDSLPKYLNSPQTALFDKSNILYGIDRARATIKQKDSVIITEGYMDVIAAHQFSLENTVAPMGTALTDKQLSLIRPLTKNIILALDADSAGILASKRSVNIIDESIPLFSRFDLSNFEDKLQKEVQILCLPQGKDLDQVIFETPDLILKLINDTKPIHDFILQLEIDKIKANRSVDKSKIISDIIPTISNIRDKTKKGQYIEIFSSLLNINSRFLTEELYNYIKSESTKKTIEPKKQIKHPLDEQEKSRRFEEYCLALLLNFPDLKTTNSKISSSYFEHPENRDILLKWQHDSDVNSIIANLDPAIHDYFNQLLLFNKHFPPSLAQNKNEREYALNDCINQLQERYVKSLEKKKELILAEEKETGDSETQLARLMKHGITESQQLKDIFKKRSSFFNRTKGD